MTNLYTEEDIKQWKEGNQRIADILQRKASSYVPGDRYPKQLSMQYLDEAFVSLAEKDGPRFLALVRASVACDCLLWKSAINHRSKPETLETIQQMGVGPIVTALLISQELGRETAELFLSCLYLFINVRTCLPNYCIAFAVVLSQRTPPYKMFTTTRYLP